MSDPGVPFSSPAAAGPVEVAPRLWWVGPVLDDDLFQNHAYLVEAGDESVLVDPGSTMTIDATLEKIAAVIDPERLRWVIVHHSDPDVADGLHRLDEVLDPNRTTVITEWRAEALMRHYGISLPFRTVEDLGWHLDLDAGRRLDFVLTPYLHFPGAFVTLDTSSRTLLSADLFGGFNSARRLIARHHKDLEDLRQFHQHYMPSREILMTGLAAIRAAMPDITTICPQHGYVIPKELVDAAFDELNALECGIFMQSRSDGHLRELLETATVVRPIDDTLRSGITTWRMSDIVLTELRHVLPAEEVWFEAATTSGPTPAGAPVHRFRVAAAPGTTPEPTLETALGTTTDPAPVSPSDDGRPTESDDRHLVVPVQLDDGRSAAAIVRLSRVTVVRPEVAAMFVALAPAIRVEVGSLLAALDAAERERRLTDIAYLDPLTGVPNRRALDDLVRPVGTPGVLMIDIDHFKAVNDTHGHAVGDEVLRRVAHGLTDGLRIGERVFRYGGEEFVVIVDVDGVTALASIAERLRQTVAAVPVGDLMGEGHAVTVSVGAHLQRDGEDTAAAIDHADAALYRAKNAGRNRVEIC